MYVDDFYYFSQSPEVEALFEKQFSSAIDLTLNGPVDYFLGITFNHSTDAQGNVTIHMSQQAFIDNLLQMVELDKSAITSVPTPYRSGFPVDRIPTLPPTDKTPAIKHFMQRLIGLLNWLSISTRPDITIITAMIAKYISNPNGQHVNAAKQVIKYLKGTRDLGITFSTQATQNLEAYIKFPIQETIVGLSDANWGPQDASFKPTTEPTQLELFKSRSISEFVLWMYGPLHWSSKRQDITARSTAEAEVYATDECAKYIAYLQKIIFGLGLSKQLLPDKTIVYNDNNACICWSHNMTTKGLRHIQVRENGVCEMIQRGIIDVQHIDGKLNLADLFTKEDKSPEHFISLRDVLVQPFRSAFIHDNTGLSFQAEGGNRI